jgi:hypothetical protein
MESRTFNIAQLFMLAGTRAALGLGVGLLISDRMSSEMKRKVGWSLVGLGALSTIPFAIKIFSNPKKVRAIASRAAKRMHA